MLLNPNTKWQGTHLPHTDNTVNGCFNELVCHLCLLSLNSYRQHLLKEEFFCYSAAINVRIDGDIFSFPETMMFNFVFEIVLNTQKYLRLCFLYHENWNAVLASPPLQTRPRLFHSAALQILITARRDMFAGATLMVWCWKGTFTVQFWHCHGTLWIVLNMQNTTTFSDMFSVF